MDLGLIASTIVPFIVKGVEAFSRTIGAKAAENIGELCNTIETKFKGDSYAENTLTRAKDKPDSKKRQAALEDILDEKMEEDPDFAEKLNTLVEALKGNSSTPSVFDQQGQRVNGSQTNIAGDVNGDVFSGIIRKK